MSTLRWIYISYIHNTYIYMSILFFWFKFPFHRFSFTFYNIKPDFVHIQKNTLALYTRAYLN